MAENRLLLGIGLLPYYTSSAVILQHKEAPESEDSRALGWMLCTSKHRRGITTAMLAGMVQFLIREM